MGILIYQNLKNTKRRLQGRLFYLSNKSVTLWPIKPKKMIDIILADNQEITRAGIVNIFSQVENANFINAYNKKELISSLIISPNAFVILDYSLFDIHSVDDLFILSDRFKEANWLLFSNDLSENFIKQIYINTHNISILYKDCTAEELIMALHEMQKGHRYISNVVSSSLLNNAYKHIETERSSLTTTEQLILKDIAFGKTTKEIAADRHVSIHTIVSHRKNIFRKIAVNNVHEATKYAVKAGLIDLAEYFI